MRRSDKPKEPEVLLACERSEEQERQLARGYSNKAWVHLNARERDELIADFEFTMLQTFDHLPKPLWMR